VNDCVGHQHAFALKLDPIEFISKAFAAYGSWRPKDGLTSDTLHTHQFSLTAESIEVFYGRKDYAIFIPYERILIRFGFDDR
jgi:hypothetical protein